MGYVHNESETNREIIQFLWDKLQETDWPFKPRYCGRGCGCHQGNYCESCEVEQGEEHKPGCAAKATMARIEAFIQAEAEREEEAASCSAD